MLAATHGLTYMGVAGRLKPAASSGGMAKMLHAGERLLVMQVQSNLGLKLA